MQPIPQPLKNISIYVYLDGPVIGRGVDPVIKDAVGTYSIGTLITNVFYNLDIDKGTIVENPKVHNKYVAIGETENGEKISTPWMYCLEGGKQPKFGRTINYRPGELSDSGSLGMSMPPYIILAPLTDITVSQVFPPPAIGQRGLITNGKGNIISTRVGTPHEMGVQVTSGDRIGEFNIGDKNIMITGRTSEGHVYSVDQLTAISNGDPAIFLRTFPL